MEIGLVLFPHITALDLVGPFEVLSRVPDCRTRMVWQETGPVRAQHGLTLHADTAFAECPQLDVLLVPGGAGQVEQMENPAMLTFLRGQAAAAKWVTSVCTGTLLLGAAGLLQGYRATTHWRYLDCLPELGATPVRKRIVADRNRVTAAGVSAGIDMALFLAALLAGEQTAQSIQLGLEYDPQPPFASGSPERAEPELLELVREETQALYDRRLAQIRALSKIKLAGTD